MTSLTARCYIVLKMLSGTKRSKSYKNWKKGIKYIFKDDSIPRKQHNQ